MKSRTQLPLLLLFFCLLMSPSCEKYQKVPENGPFAISAEVIEANDSWVVFELTLCDGVIEGDNTLAMTILGKDKSSPAFTLNDEDGNSLSAGTVWRFPVNGKTKIVIKGLNAGEYGASVQVNRYYHSASCDFKISI